MDDTMKPEVVQMDTLTADTLTTTDRCDRCGAQAYVQITLKGGGDLRFCVHHYSAHADKLADVAEHIVDESHRLTSAV